MLITPSFFFGEINIPNSDSTDISESIEASIAFNEPECLKKILGYDLAVLVDTTSTDQRIIDLIQGVSYVDSANKTKKWRGLIYQSGGLNFSLIAFYIYYFYMKDKAIWNSGTGTVVPEGNVAMAVSPGFKMMNAYNIFVRQNRELYDFMISSEDVYPEYDVSFSTFRTVNDFDI
jgi:hypothetical protein